MESNKPYAKRLNSYEGDMIFDSRIENIDTAMFNFINDEMNLHAHSKSGFHKVPVLMATAERARLSKKDSEIRDKDGTLNFPIITIERTSITKSPGEKGTVWANVPALSKTKGGSIPVAQRIVQDKSSNFANADAKRIRGQLNFPRENKKVVYKTVSIPLPIYITVMYSVTLKTEYQQQMNELVVPFITTPGGINYIIIRDRNHRYEGFIQQDYSHDNNISNFSNEERIFQTKFDIKVLGHLIGDGVNQERPHNPVRETIVEVKIPRERAMLDPDEIAKYDL